MYVFIANKKEARVLSKELNQTGILHFSTRVEIRGNHLKGNVPVKVRYEARFIPDEEFWGKDDRYPDEEPYPVSYTRAFLTENERREHCATWYRAIAEGAA